MKQYLDLIEHVLVNGEYRKDRTGTGTKGIFGYQNRYDLSQGFPLLTTKDMRDLFPKIFHELKWFINGDTNIKYLVDNNCNIWNADAYRWYCNQLGEGAIPLSKKEFIRCIKEHPSFAKQWGDLGRIYGKQWRDFGKVEGYVSEYWGENAITEIGGIDQLAEAINTIKNDPFSRRIIVNAWNPFDLSKGVALPPCHVMFQFYVSNDRKLSCQLYQRSADIFLGVPFNIASYALLVHMLAYTCDLRVGEFIHTLGDAHIYLNHLQQVTEQLKREPLPLPRLEIIPREGLKSLEDFRLEDFKLSNYQSHEKLTGEVSVGK